MHASLLPAVHRRWLYLLFSFVYSGLESCFFFFPLCVSWTRSASSCCSSTGPSETLPWRSCCVTCSRTNRPEQSSTTSVFGGMRHSTDICFVFLHIRDSSCCYCFLKATLLFVCLFPHQVVLKMQSSPRHHARCLFVSYLHFDLCPKWLTITFHPRSVIIIFSVIFTMQIFICLVVACISLLSITRLLYSCFHALIKLKIKINVWKWFFLICFSVSHITRDGWAFSHSPTTGNSSLRMNK